MVPRRRYNRRVDDTDLLRLPPDDLVRAAARHGVRLRVLPGRDALYADFADALVAEVRRAEAEDRPCRLIVPVGPRGQYPVFVRRCNAGRVDLRRLHLFAMDEYLDWQGRWIPEDHPLSFRGYLRREVADALDPALGFDADARLYVPDPLAIDAYSRRVLEVGGIDCCFGGLGVHGHVAFNEPPLSRFQRVSARMLADSLTRVLPLAPETLVMNATRQWGGAFADFPPMAVTVGMRDIRSARRIRLYCDGGAWQRCALRQLVAGPVGVEYPATLLRGHPDLEVVADVDTAAPAR